MANEEYKFPDEQDVTPDIEIDIEEDTPEEDRGRQPMPKEIVQKLDSDDDELAEYDETVKQKLKQLKKVWHDERREKEAALREHNEAIALARQLLEENQRIKGTLRTGEQEYVTTVQDAANLEMNAAKRAYKEAYESGDSDALTDAQQALTRAELKLIRANNLRPSLQEEDYDVQQLQARLQPRDRKSTRLNSSHMSESRMPSSA